MAKIVLKDHRLVFEHIHEALEDVLFVGISAYERNQGI